MIAKTAYVDDSRVPPGTVDEQLAAAPMPDPGAVEAVLRALPATRRESGAFAVLSAERAVPGALQRSASLRIAHRLDEWLVWHPTPAAADAAAPTVPIAFVERVARRATAIDWDLCVAALVEGCVLGLLDLSRVEDRAFAIRVLLRHACRPVQVASARRRSAGDGAPPPA